MLRFLDEKTHLPIERAHLILQTLFLAGPVFLLALLLTGLTASADNPQTEESDRIGPTVKNLSVYLNISSTWAVATISGAAYDLPDDGNATGVDYVVLFNNDIELENASGETIRIPVEDGNFSYSLPLYPLNASTGDLSYLFTARAFDRAGNAGMMSEPAILTQTGRPDRIRLITPSESKGIAINEREPENDNHTDGTGDICITFLSTTPGDDYRLLILRYLKLENQNDALSLGLPEGYRFLRGVWEVETFPKLQGFTAQISINFRMDEHTTPSPELERTLKNIRVAGKWPDKSGWSPLNSVGDNPESVDYKHNLYRITCRVNNFSEYALVIARPDLRINRLELSPCLDDGREELNISVNVTNGGVFPAVAENVTASVYFVVKGDSPRYLGTIYFGTILPEGYAISYLHSDYLHLLDPETLEPYSIMVTVDPAEDIDEKDEENNTAEVPLTDDLPPEIEVAGEYNDSVVKGKIFMEGNASDDIYVLRVEYRIDGQGEWKRAGGEIRWHIGINTERLKDGEHTIELRAYDGKNYSRAENITLRVKNRQPAMSNIEVFIAVFTIIALITGTIVFFSEEILSRVENLMSKKWMKLHATEETKMENSTLATERGGKNEAEKETDMLKDKEEVEGKGG